MNTILWSRAIRGLLGRLQRRKNLRQAVVAHLKVLPVASAQLRETNRQIERAVAQVGANFERMAERAREGADQASQLLGAAGQTAGGAASGVGKLLSSSQTTLEDLLDRIVRDGEVCRKLVERMDAVERDIGHVVRGLGDVDRISFGNTILALNAKIEAAHMGERGQGFEIVAESLWAQSRQSEQITGQIRTTMLRLAGDAKAAGVAIGGMASADQDRTAALHTQVHAALDRLKQANEEAQRAVADGADRQQKLSAEIASAVQAMQFQDSVSQKIGHIEQALESMQTAIAAPLGLVEPPQARSAAAIGLLSQSYTMEGERTVHAAVTGEKHSGGEALDDVEIF